MSRPRRYKSRVKGAIHEATEGLFLAGMISEKRMRECDGLCLTKAGKATAAARRQRRRARAEAKASTRAGTRNPHHGSTLESFLKEEDRRRKLKKPKYRH